MLIRGVCIDENIELCSYSGERLTFKDFGFIYIGEVTQDKFFILNNSPTAITCLARTFNKTVFDISNIEIDEKRGNFVVKQTPSSFSHDKNNISSRVNEEKFRVEAFKDFEFCVSL